MLAAWPTLVYTGAVRKAPGRPAKGPHGGFPRAPDSGRMRAPELAARPLRGRVAGVVASGWARGAHENADREAPFRGFLFFWVGLGAHFCLQRPSGAVEGDAVTGMLRERLIALVEPVLERQGYELVDLEFAAGRAHAVVRLFIDGPAGVGLEDCAAASREVSALLDAEDPIPNAYTLEVSSPGFDRVLRTRAHFGRFVGSRVHVELKDPRAGRRRYTGKLLTVDDSGIALEVDQEHVALTFKEIGKARLAPN
jgi:ribosome maturation factor RimP